MNKTQRIFMGLVLIAAGIYVMWYTRHTDPARQQQPPAASQPAR